MAYESVLMLAATEAAPRRAAFSFRMTWIGIDESNRLYRPLLTNALRKALIAELVDDFRNDPPAEIDPAPRQRVQGAIPGFPGQAGDEQVQSLDANIRLADEPGFSDQRRRVSGGKPFGKPGRLIFLGITKELIDGMQAVSGYHPVRN